MERIKTIARRLLFPHPLLTGLLLPVAAALLIEAFVNPNAHPALVYGSYLLSAYALVIGVAAAPGACRACLRFWNENPLMRRWRTDVRFQLEVSLLVSLAVNALYALMQLALGVYHHAGWFYALSGYYALLAAMRWVLVGDVRRACFGRDRFTELLRCRLCGILLLLINQALTVMTAYIVWQNRGFEHHEIVTIAMAAFTFASLATAIAGMIRFRRHKNPVVIAAKAISLAGALVSILSLETSMLSAFGQDESPLFRRIMTGATGFAVCTAVLVMAVVMIVRSTQEIKQIKRGVKQHE